MLGEHFPLVVIGCAEVLLAVVLLCAAADGQPAGYGAQNCGYRRRSVGCGAGGRAVRHRRFRAVQAADCGEKRGCGWIRYCRHRYSAVHAAAVRDGADTHVPAVECGTQTAQNVDRGACAAVAEADIQADFPLGIDAALGWATSATDKALADTLPSVKPGEYERVNGLLEKTIYGGIALEPFEERALDLFVQRLWGRNVKKSWEMRLKLRYACLLAAK